MAEDFDFDAENDVKSSKNTRKYVLGGIAATVVTFLIIFLPVWFLVIDADDPIELETCPTDGPSYYKYIDCMPEKKPENQTETECQARGCVYEESADPKCHFGPSYGYSIASSESPESDVILHELTVNNEKPVVDSVNFKELTIKQTLLADSMARLEIAPKEDRWRVPFNHATKESLNDPKLKFTTCIDDKRSGVNVVFKDDVILRTDVGPLIYENQYMQISTLLPEGYDFYGLGEADKPRFRMDVETRSRMTIWSAGQPVERGNNLYGHHPVMMGLSPAGHAFMLVLVNSNALEVEFNNRVMTWRSQGGVFDFYILVDENPTDLVKKYHQFIGTPFMPPYWAYGFQLSRWGYPDLAEVKDVVRRNRALGIPFESQYVDIDYMERALDFTVGSNFTGLGEFADELRELDMKLILIIDPAICTIPFEVSDKPYPALEKALEKDIFIRLGHEGSNEEILTGMVWPGREGNNPETGEPWEPKSCPVAWPDWWKNETSEWWTEELVNFYKEVRYDAIWIDMNEPSNFMDGSYAGCGPENTYETPPFIPHLPKDSNDMVNKTICMTSTEMVPDENGIPQRTLHYDAHSVYGHRFSQVTAESAKHVYPADKRSWIITRSNFIGTGQYTGHWLGDNYATWEQLQSSVNGMLDMNIFGITYNGADICGFFLKAEEDQCTKWMVFGSFYPFMRNHNAKFEDNQDPAIFSEDHQIKVKHALELRYSLLPELHHLFFMSHMEGGTVVRSMPEVFYTDPASRDVWDQFLWGDDILIAPVLTEGEFQRNVYLPEKMVQLETGQFIQPGDNAVAALIPVYIRLNRPVLRQLEVAQSIVGTRKSPFTMFVALDDDSTGQEIDKTLYWDDDDNADFVVNHYLLRVGVQKTSDNWLFNFGSLKDGNFSVPGLDAINVFYDGMDQVPAKFVVWADNGGSAIVDTVITKTGFTIPGLLTAVRNIGLGTAWEGVTIEKIDETVLDRIDCSNGVDCPSICHQDTSRTKLLEVMNAPTCYMLPEDNFYTTWQDPAKNRRGLQTVWELAYTREGEQFYYEPAKKLRATIDIINNDVVRVTYANPDQERYEVPVKYNDDLSDMQVVNTEAPIPGFNLDTGAVSVSRSTGEVIFDSNAGPIIFEDQFIQLSSVLTSPYVYGIGETEHVGFKLNQTWYQQGLFARDNFVEIGANLWGVHPYFTNLEENGDKRDAHGILFKNSNAMDITVQPGKVTWRSTGGILDFYIFLGPTPADVTRQYTSLIGRPVMVPYWSLGFQICRYDYPNLTNMMEVVEGVRGYGIPYDVQYGDIDYMDRQLDFTIDPISYVGLEDYVKTIQEEYEMRFVIILDPAISVNETYLNETTNEMHNYPPYDRAMEKDVFIKRPNGDVGIGKVWPYLPGWRLEDFECQDAYGGNCWDENVDKYHAWTAFPDFFKPETTDWWSQEIKEFYDNSIAFDGLWIDMNEPASFTSGYDEQCDFDSLFNKPKFVPNIRDRDHITSKTACLDSKQYYRGDTTDTFNTHSVYGYSQAEPTKIACEASTGKRCMIISRSTYPGASQYVQHWLGDNLSIWSHLKQSIIGMLEFSLFGFSYTGPDICGHIGNATHDMCLRWQMLGAFYPFSRNHNANFNVRQDPAAWGDEFAAAVKDIYTERYRLLPFLYTLLFNANQRGDTVARSLMMEFTDDVRTLDIDEQFLWGSSFLISPALTPSNYTRAYFPPSADWYDYFTGEKTKTDYQTFYTPLEGINLHTRSGSIIPMQEPDVTTSKSRIKPFGLLYTLPREGEDGFGEMFWDDGESLTYDNSIQITFTGTRVDLQITPTVSGKLDMPLLANLTIYGLDSHPDKVIWVSSGGRKNNGETSGSFEVAKEANNVIRATGGKIDLAQTTTISFHPNMG